MAKLRVNAFSISLDGYGAGPNQSKQNPLGVGGQGLHEWAFGTRTFQERVLRKDGGETGVDDDFIARSFENLGAWVLGRNMFSPMRGAWEDDKWKGWWGDNPPYHTPVFILTHHPRPALEMDGGTTFHFVTGGMEAALEAAFEAAKGQDVRLGGGVATIREGLSKRLVDEAHIAMSPVLLGSGEHLFEGLDLLELGYRRSEHVSTPKALHFVLTKTS